MIGASFEIKITVTEADTAKTLGSGTLDVLATPKMIALMEHSAYKAIEPYLENGQGSVGTYLDVKHLSATPLGIEVSARAEVVEVDGRKITFNVTAWDEKGLIGEGKHERFIISNEKFLAKTNSKLA